MHAACLQPRDRKRSHFGTKGSMICRECSKQVQNLHSPVQSLDLPTAMTAEQVASPLAIQEAQPVSASSGGTALSDLDVAFPHALMAES